MSIAGGIGECQSRRAAGTLLGFVHVRCRSGWRRVFAAETDQLDVPADQVQVGVDAKVVVSDGARQAASWRRAIDDLVGGGNNVVGGSEIECTVTALGRRRTSCWWRVATRWWRIAARWRWVASWRSWVTTWRSRIAAWRGRIATWWRRVVCGKGCCGHDQCGESA